MIKAVIFDFDGVLTKDTITISAKELRQLFGKKPFDEHQMCLLEGAGIQSIIAELLQKELDDPEVEDITKRKLEMFRKERKRIRLLPQPLSIIRKLKEKNMKVALASGSKKENLVEMLDEQISVFDVVISEDDVERTKPDPQPYLKTAEKLELMPQECVVIENAPRGIQAAKKAGMTCIAITTTLPKEDLGKADIIVSDYEELREEIDKVIG